MYDRIAFAFVSSIYTVAVGFFGVVYSLSISRFRLHQPIYQHVNWYTSIQKSKACATTASWSNKKKITSRLPRYDQHSSRRDPHMYENTHMIVEALRTRQKAKQF